MDTRTPAESRVVTHALMVAEHANHLGHIHGGWIMKLVDETGGLAATRHARRPVVTVAVDGMVFHRPVFTGSILQLVASVVYVGRTSMDVMVEVFHEDPIQCTMELVNTAHMVYVALDQEHRPTLVPRLQPVSQVEQELFEEAAEARRQRQEG
ncbi:MAG TPA: acyl-CoA thioesterase [Fibrobacteria bacterium]|nr:acyl-CoA thioesterase [Fibrobacteria bacterium]HOX52433.1 acyl-CoA thioesterase [Fibrobacteria bacterium]